MSTRVSHPFGPVCDELSRVLVLGSMPSPVSRAEGFYYAHPQNRFWRVMAALWDEKLPSSTSARRSFCLRHRVALWDVLASCSIEGAADASISDVVANDIAGLVSTTGIASVFCTGSVATRLYRRLVEPAVGIACVGLPSTSSANARYSLPKLVRAYEVIRQAAEDRV